MIEQLNEYIHKLKVRAKARNIQGDLYVSLEVTSIVRELEDIVSKLEDQERKVAND
jgi:hypothetical protein